MDWCVSVFGTTSVGGRGQEVTKPLLLRVRSLCSLPGGGFVVRRVARTVCEAARVGNVHWALWAAPAFWLAREWRDAFCCCRTAPTKVGNQFGELDHWLFQPSVFSMTTGEIVWAARRTWVRVAARVVASTAGERRRTGRGEGLFWPVGAGICAGESAEPAVGLRHNLDMGHSSGSAGCGGGWVNGRGTAGAGFEDPQHIVKHDF
jgi:hypothetical protein